MPTEDELIVWTAFPSPYVDDELVTEYDVQTDMVSMPLSYWKAVVRYILDAERNIELVGQIYTYIELEWAKFPSPYHNSRLIVIYDEETNTVSMPLSYWKAITIYVLETEKNIEIVKHLKIP